MPINFDLENIRKKYDCKIYFETGLYDVDNKNNSCCQATLCNFDKIFSIEIREDFVQKAKTKFSNKQNVKIICDDSSNLNLYLNNVTEKCLFFLDAHVDNSNIKNFKFRCPLFEEIKAIKNHHIKNHIICIDDVRILKNKNPWNEKQYGNINFLEEIQKNILSINSEYKFFYLDGFIKNDVLLCYI